jgi:hypothetical protein
VEAGGAMFNKPFWESFGMFSLDIHGAAILIIILLSVGFFFVIIFLWSIDKNTSKLWAINDELTEIRKILEAEKNSKIDTENW